MSPWLPWPGPVIVSAAVGLVSAVIALVYTVRARRDGRPDSLPYARGLGLIFLATCIGLANTFTQEDPSRPVAGILALVGLWIVWKGWWRSRSAQRRP